MSDEGNTPPAPPKGAANQMFMMMMLFAMMFLMFNRNIRAGIGNAMGSIMDPLLAMDGQVPLMTILITGSIMVAITSLIRHFFTDYVAMARSQHKSKFFSKEMREARLAGNNTKVEKLMKIQPEIMQENMNASMGNQMKSMMITMVIVISVFSWLYIFIDSLDYTLFAVPWYDRVDLVGSTVLPNWLLLYSTLSIPTGQVISRITRYLSFRKRLADLENGVEVKKGDEE